MTRLWASVRRYSTTIAWTANIVVVSLLFVGIVETQDRVEQEGLERDYELCVNSNKARAGLVAFVEELIPADAGPQAQKILDLARERFAQVECPPDPSP